MTPNMTETGTVDLCAHCGPFERRPIGLEPTGLCERLAPWGVTRVFAGRLEALWFENPHDANRLAGPAGRPNGPTEFVPVPVLDASLATWREELDRLAASGPLSMVRLVPSYHGYTLAQADPLLAALSARKVVAQVLVRVVDPRRQHRRAQVPDVPAAEVRDAARRHPALRVLLSGATTPALNALAHALPEQNNLWADTSQADGVEAVKGLVAGPWRDRLVFGSHAPLFVPEAAFARVVLDLDDADAERVLRGNAAALIA
jgi:predicted TIM-barrel fold metal-dependent hydrolase